MLLARQASKSATPLTQNSRRNVTPIPDQRLGKGNVTPIPDHRIGKRQITPTPKKQAREPKLAPKPKTHINVTPIPRPRQTTWRATDKGTKQKDVATARPQATKKAEEKKSGSGAKAAPASPRKDANKQAGRKSKPPGRAGRQARLKGLAEDPKLSSADRGWIRQEINSIKQGTRQRIRVPPGKDLAHERGREAAKGYSYDPHSYLQVRKLHRLQHKHDNYGRANRERPCNCKKKHTQA